MSKANNRLFNSDLHNADPHKFGSDRNISPLDFHLTSPINKLTVMNNDMYLNETDLPTRETQLKQGISELFNKAKNKAFAGETTKATLTNLAKTYLSTEPPNKDHITVIDFCEIIFGLFNIKKRNDNAEEAYLHLTKLLENKTHFSAIVDNTLIKMAVWKLLLTDINLVIFKERYCTYGSEGFLGVQFKNYWEGHFEITLANVQVLNIVQRIIDIPLDAPPDDVILTLLQLCDNKFKTLANVKAADLFGGPQESYKLKITDSKDRQNSRAEGEQIGTGTQKYLKYKTKYLRLKNSGF
jgi:hypothetical protein